jgi:hypothetical protein
MRHLMARVELGIGVLVGAAMLAVWVDGRLGERSPSTIVKVLLHGLAAYLVVHLAASVAVPLFDPSAFVRTMAALFLIVMPAWVYAFLVSLWALKLVRSAASLR